MAPHPTLSTTIEEHTAFYFNTYSRDCLVQVNMYEYFSSTLFSVLFKKKCDICKKYTYKIDKKFDASHMSV